MPIRPYKHKVVTVDDERDVLRARKGRVIVIDDDAPLREALGEMLAMEGYAQELYGSGLDFLESLARPMPVYAGPCCILCDVKLPGLNGLALQKMLLAQRDTPFILMSGLSGIEEATTGFRAGAFDFLVKPVAVDDLLRVIELALARSRDQGSLLESQKDLLGRVGTLTSRELQVARHVVAGRTNPDIAQEMGIALRTVKLYRQHAMEKLGAQTLADLVRLVDAAHLE